ncbi:MAG: hypothetical protein JWM82_784, partial [Myxococcales bacterium]|nr:hypothetical protein [Myxococcales bacterium]
APPVAAPAVAAPAASPVKPKEFPALTPPSFSHKYQFGLSVLPGTGYRAIFPYQKNNQAAIFCGQKDGQTDKSICTQRLPVFLDVQPSFGFANHWDVLVDLRFGLEQDFTQTREFAVAPGVRYWVDPEEDAKFFATIQMAYDTTKQLPNTQVTNNDFGIRNSNGFMFEIMRNFGVYAQFGETIGFRRWLRFEIDAGLGVQARLP